MPLPTSWKPVLILCSHLRLGLPSFLLPSGFPIKILYARFVFRILATCPAHLIHPDLITRMIFGEEYKLESFSLFSLLLSSYSVPLRPKYPFQNPILQNHQPTFLPHCERPSFIPIHNIRHNYSSVCLNHHILVEERWEYMCAETCEGKKILWKVTLVRPRHGWEEIIITVRRFILRGSELKWLRMAV